MEIPVHVQSLQSSILNLTSFQMDNTFWGVVSAAVEQSRCKANMFAPLRREIRPLRLTSESIQAKKMSQSPITIQMIPSGQLKKS